MHMSENEYQKLSEKASPGSPVAKDCLKAFLIGGLICALGECISQLAAMAGLEPKLARLVASVSLILIAVILTGLQVFENIAKHAGAGTLVPITGFANSVVAPAIEFKAEGLCSALAPRCSLSPGRCWYTASPPAPFTVWCCIFCR